MNSENTHLLSQSFQDLQEDFEELEYLINSQIEKIRTFLKDIKTTKAHIFPETYADIISQAQTYIAVLTKQKETLAHALIRMNKNNLTEQVVMPFADQKLRTHDMLRTYQGIIGALVTATDWQSPTFLHTIHSQAGRQTGKIYATINDYKRDQHWDAHDYERAFLKEYVDNWIKFPINAYVTASGMAAFTTILSFLMLENKAKGAVVIGKSIYFENKELVLKAFGDIVIEVDESDTDAILDCIKTVKPSIIILDSLANSPTIAVPDLDTIIPFLVKYSREETYLIIDNTCLSFTFQPLRYVFGKHSTVRLIVFESLNKYHQFGMDRVTGGIIWCYGGDTIKLFDYRVCLGTNMPDLAVVSLPRPSRKFLTKRLLRHQRNTLALASYLESYIIDHPDGPFARIIYPGLPNHPASVWKSRRAFNGSYFVVELKKRYQTIPSDKRFVAMVIREAKRDRLTFSSGTSFGFNTTRVYLTAVRYTKCIPFLRVSVGTEISIDIERLKTVFTRVFNRF